MRLDFTPGSCMLNFLFILCVFLAKVEIDFKIQDSLRIHLKSCILTFSVHNLTYCVTKLFLITLGFKYFYLLVQKTLKKTFIFKSFLFVF